MRYYYALWIPTTENITLAVLEKAECEIKLQDSKQYGGYKVKAIVDTESLDIDIYYSLLAPKNSAKNIKLVKEFSNNKGFIIYYIEHDNWSEDAFITSLEGKMNPSFYHLIKGFFHKHVYHDASDDALLQPYVSDQTLTWNNDGEVITQFYLDQYKQKFSDFLNESTTECAIYRKRINGLFKVESAIKGLISTIEKGNLIKGEQEYYDFILKTAANQNVITKQFRKDVRKTLFEINKFLTSVSDIYNRTTASIGVRFGWIGIWVGAVGILASVGGTCYSCFQSPNYTEVYHHMDSVANVNLKTIENINGEKKTDYSSIYIHVDSVIDMQHKNTRSFIRDCGIIKSRK